MAIVKVDPPDWQNFNVVQIDSNAPDNTKAVLEMEKWAAEHGFLRTGEYHLRRLIFDGENIFRGICYRMSVEELQSLIADQERINRLRESMPVTEHTLAR